MTRIILLLTIMLVAFLSCTTTNELKVESEFKKYAYNNFDDPKSVKEIVSIEFVNHTNTDSLKNLVQTLTDIIDKQYVEDSIIVERYTRTTFIDNLVKNSRNISENTRLKYTSAFKKWGLFINDDYYSYISLRNRNRIILSSDSIMKPFDVSVYKIKFRQKVNENLELKEYYAIFDNTKNKDNINIQSKKLTDDQYPEWFIYCSDNCEEMIKIKDRFSDVSNDLKKAYINIKIELNDKCIDI